MGKRAIIQKGKPHRVNVRAPREFSSKGKSMTGDTKTVKAYVRSIRDDAHDKVPRTLVEFQLEWPSGAISPTYRVSVKARFSEAVDMAWPSVVSFFEEIREADQIELVEMSNNA